MASGHGGCGVTRLRSGPSKQKKRPELVDVRMIRWDRERGLFGIMTVYDDSVVSCRLAC
jgi:hypothetical protein